MVNLIVELFGPLTLEETGAVLNMSRTWVEQIERVALRKVRVELNRPARGLLSKPIVAPQLMLALEAAS